MPNPYASVGSVATVTANVSGNDNLNDFNDLPGQGGPDSFNGQGASHRVMTTGEVTRRVFSYVRPHLVLLVASFVASAATIVLQLYVPILIGRGIDLIIGAGKVNFDALAHIRQCAIFVSMRTKSSPVCHLQLSTAMPMEI